MVLFDEDQRFLLSVNYPGHDEYSEVLASLGSFLEEKVLPQAPGLDEGTLAMSTVRRSAMEQGLCQIPFPAEFDGLGLPFGVYSLAIEMVGYADAGLALSAA